MVIAEFHGSVDVARARHPLLNHAHSASNRIIVNASQDHFITAAAAT